MAKDDPTEWDAPGLESFLKGDSAARVSILIQHVDAQLRNRQNQGGICNLASRRQGSLLNVPYFSCNLTHCVK